MSAVPNDGDNKQGPLDRTNDHWVSSGIKSRPHYRPLEVDADGQCHLLVVEASGIESARRLLVELADRRMEVEVYWLGETPEAWVGKAMTYAFDDLQALTLALTDRLARSCMGLRLYLAGREAFVWEASIPARQAGLREDEIQREACGSRARRVFCVHCRFMLQGVVTNPVTCPNCGMLLEVRDHFSRALAAYLGVIINAEDPQDMPEPEDHFV